MKSKSILNTRSAVIYAMICLSFALILIRIAVIITSDLGQEASQVTTKTVSFGRNRGYIYDRNLVPLVNCTAENTAVVVSSPKTAELINKLSNGNSQVQNGLLLTFNTQAEICDSNVLNVKQVNRYPDSLLCSHIIGYTDYTGKGVCGIEKSFDKVLRDAGGELSISYSCDAFGRVLMGEAVTINDNGYNSPAGIVLTIDAKIQRIAEDVLIKSKIQKGACVITETQTGEIVASASIPTYDINHIADDLENENAPFLNRVLCAYPVGSVFKPFIAACALENGGNLSEIFNCKGFYRVGNTEFHCFNRRVHEAENLTEAICNSCNCYFIDLGKKTGSAGIRKTCRLLGFGKEIRLTSDIKSGAGNVPSTEDLNNPAELANLCFGQGKLLATPLQLCAAYSAIGNGGVYIEPYITKYLLDENKEQYAYFSPENVYNVFSNETCGILTECLSMNMLEGTGANGCPDNVSSAGKTATAQTGEYDSMGNERLCTWFCGFFPAELPLYTVCIFNEDGSTAAEDCAPVFKEIAERISAGN